MPIAKALDRQARTGNLIRHGRSWDRSAAISEPAAGKRPESAPKIGLDAMSSSLDDLILAATAAPGLEPVQPALLHEQVYVALKYKVMAGHFEPGEAVTVRRLAEQFETSPMPVREALRRLVSQNAFEALPNRTVRIPEFSPEKVRSLARVRAEFEGTAAAWAAETITKPEIQALMRLYAAECTAVERDDAIALLDANRELHFSIYEAARCPPMLPCLETLWLQVGPYLGFLKIDDKVREVMTLHLDAIRALKCRDAEGARRAIAENILRAAEHLLSIWNERATAAV
jgi:DNA-binding GntR family transcriptional regulator